MKTIKVLLTAFVISMGLVFCGTQKQQVNTNRSIIGSWQGCDGRVVTFTRKGDSILGHYTELNGLERFGFTRNEIGHKLIKESAGSYSGLVKWRAVNIKEPTWRTVNVFINGNVYKDQGSDRCGRDMTRITK
ncbi:hypothetical protein ATE92_0963 [Ulvibacter sp. MAR_2010_11]|uniref:hypothetical protein n=1 Tax=Ulvibacter sp. MAR_2010_11 TaxID=1250229 RepID=UPI000C2C7535|nr:hypothetical protein [Ulvibacter sp. MAR_2010_11]PKA82824.1 hypothetical protein ATE92_0963 [Ulvibacter sp. MAR_2010_11]